MSRNKNKYKFSSFLFDAFMCIITAGLWLIRIYVRETRR